ncbi:MAG: helix-turn-helix domain-containing protein [Acidovorax sp.]|nr:helix-turn-helix domain-containing protein [Acidovorax sp.]
MNAALVLEPPLIDEDAAQMLAALGSMPRLTIYRSLLRAGARGLNVTELQEATLIPGSTLKHHVMALVDAGLLLQERRAREVYSTARFSEVRRLSAFLLRECCADEGGIASQCL